MKLSARSRYAVRILLELAKGGQEQTMSAMVLSYHTGISVQFVEQILKPLKQKGFTSSVRGAAGGHKLARNPKDITLGQIVGLMENGISLTVCCKDNNMKGCPRKEGCLTHTVWKKLSQILQAELDAISIFSLLPKNTVCALGDEKAIKAMKGKQIKLNQPAANASAKEGLAKVRKARAPIARRIRLKKNV